MFIVSHTRRLCCRNLAGGDPNIVAVIVSGSKEAVKNALHRIQSILADSPTSRYSHRFVLARGKRKGYPITLLSVSQSPCGIFFSPHIRVHRDIMSLDMLTE